MKPAGGIAGVAGALCLALGCGDPIDERDVAGQLAHQVDLGEGIVVRTGGATVRAEVPPTVARAGRIRVRAQSLDVRIEVEVARCEARVLEIVAGPLPPRHLRATERPFLAGLSAGDQAAREVGGSGAAFVADAHDPDWAPLDAEAPFDCPRDGLDLVWTLHLNVDGRGTYRVECGEAGAPPPPPAAACATTSVGPAAPLGATPLIIRHRLRYATPAPADGVERLTFAIVGNNAGVTRLRRRFVDDLRSRAEALGVAFVVVNGDLTADGDLESLEAARADFDGTDERPGLPVPWFATVGDRDVDGLEPEEIVDTLGATTFAFDVGPARIMVLDSAGASLSARTHARLDDWLDGETLWWPAAAVPPARLVVTHFPPFEPAPLGGGAFKSRREAARVVAALHRAGGARLVASHLALYEVQRVAGVEIVHTGGGGAPMAPGSGDDHHWLLVTVERRGTDIRVTSVPQPL